METRIAKVYLLPNGQTCRIYQTQGNIPFGGAPGYWPEVDGRHVRETVDSDHMVVFQTMTAVKSYVAARVPPITKNWLGFKTNTEEHKNG